MVRKYSIFVDGKGYAGESNKVEPVSPRMGSGWTSYGPREVNGIEFGEPVVIVGFINLKSHLQRVLDRCGSAQEIVIRQQS